MFFGSCRLIFKQKYRWLSISRTAQPHVRLAFCRAAGFFQLLKRHFIRIQNFQFERFLLQPPIDQFQPLASFDHPVGANSTGEIDARPGEVFFLPIERNPIDKLHHHGESHNGRGSQPFFNHRPRSFRRLDRNFNPSLIIIVVAVNKARSSYEELFGA